MSTLRIKNSNLPIVYDRSLSSQHSWRVGSVRLDNRTHIHTKNEQNTVHVLSSRMRSVMVVIMNYWRDIRNDAFSAHESSRPHDDAFFSSFASLIQDL